MTRLIIDLPDEIGHDLAAAAEERNRTEAEVVLDLLRRELRKTEFRPPAFSLGERPVGALFASDVPDLASNCDKYLEGFGED